MKETRKRGIPATEEGRQKLTAAKAAKRNHEGKVWTYLDIATEAGVNETTVKRFFRGDGVDRESAISICNALDLEVKDIVEANEWNPPTPTHTNRNKLARYLQQSFSNSTTPPPSNSTTI